MGTRGFLGFVIDGTEKIAYNHFDSYPSGLGSDVLSWLRIATSDGTVHIAERARALTVVDPNSTPTAQQIEQLREFANLNVGTQDVEDWYVLLRETQGNPGAMLQAGYIEDAGQFPLDSLFAEWGYLVDLDADVFEVYRGFQHAKHDKGRFADREPFKPPHRANLATEYWPVALERSWRLVELPTDEEFLNALEGEE